MTDERIVDMIAESYINVYGVEKWLNLSDEQKHDVIMFIAKDLLKAL